jgi:thiol-disulfide isomerase/thioredoxin
MNRLRIPIIRAGLLLGLLICTADCQSAEVSARCTLAETALVPNIVGIASLQRTNNPLYISSPKVAQKDKKPSDALKQLVNQQRKLLDNLERDIEAGKAQPAENENIQETIRQQAAQRAAQFKLADWKDAELRELGLLYELAEAYGSVVEAFRLYLKGNHDPNEAPSVKAKIIRALIETEQLAEAAREFDELKKESMRRLRDILPARVALAKELAFAYRDRGEFDAALKYAQEAFELADLPPFLARREVARDLLAQEQASCASLIVPLLERANKTREAERLQGRLQAGLFKEHPQLKAMFDNELALNRLYGKPAPELSASRWLDSSPLSLSELRGKVVLLDFWAMWCPPCVKAFPYLRELQTKHGDKGLAIIGVTRFYGRSDASDNLNREQEWQALQAFKRKHQLSWPVAVGKMDDLTNDERFGVQGLPVTFLLDRRGNVREIHRGASNYRKLAQRVARLLEEK